MSHLDAFFSALQSSLDIPISRSSELQRLFTFFDSDFHHREPDRQIIFRFHHDSACTDALLIPSLHSCILCNLQRCIPTQGSFLDMMIFFAWLECMAAVDAAEPSDEAMYVDIYPQRMAPTDDPALESLSKKKVSPADWFSTCAVCLEEFGDGEEATSIPCSHVFHGECIKVWLKRSNCCPTCRFVLPVSS